MILKGSPTLTTFTQRNTPVLQGIDRSVTGDITQTTTRRVLLFYRLSIDLLCGTVRYTEVFLPAHLGNPFVDVRITPVPLPNHFFGGAQISVSRRIQ